MQRFCAHCDRAFTPEDLARAESKQMEGERKSAGLKGVRFLYYTCPGCDFADIFVDVLSVPGESAEAFQARKADLEATARQLHADHVEVVVGERNPLAGD